MEMIRLAFYAFCVAALAVFAFGSKKQLIRMLWKVAFAVNLVWVGKLVGDVIVNNGENPGIYFLFLMGGSITVGIMTGKLLRPVWNYLK